jgi:hypothetical protein
MASEGAACIEENTSAGTDKGERPFPERAFRSVGWEKQAPSQESGTARRYRNEKLLRKRIDGLISGADAKQLRAVYSVLWAKLEQ